MVAAILQAVGINSDTSAKSAQFIRREPDVVSREFGRRQRGALQSQAGGTHFRMSCFAPCHADHVGVSELELPECFIEHEQEQD
jgi:hypothetical protein